MDDLLSDKNHEPELASKRIRVYAILLDYLIFFTFMSIIVINFGEKVIDEEGSSYQLKGQLGFIIPIFWFIQFVIIESITSQTIGKMCFKIKVVSIDYTKNSFAQSLTRHLFDIIDYLPFVGMIGLLVASNNKLKQRVGDLVAKTIVINI